MKKLRIRLSNGVNPSYPFSASIRGGVRGYADACAIEAHSNDICPTIKTLTGFTVIVEPYEILEVRAVGRERTEEEKHRRHLYGDKGATFKQRQAALRTGGG